MPLSIDLALPTIDKYHAVINIRFASALDFSLKDSEQDGLTGKITDPVQ